MNYEDVVEFYEETLQEAEGYRQIIERMRKGEKLCKHHWCFSDNCYETYCTGCGKHTGSINDAVAVPPLEEDNFCSFCTEKKKHGKQTQLL